MRTSFFAKSFTTVFASLREAVEWMNLVPKDYRWHNGDIDTDEYACIRRGEWECCFESGSTWVTHTGKHDLSFDFTLRSRADPKIGLKIFAYVPGDQNDKYLDPELRVRGPVWRFERNESFRELNAILKVVAPELLLFAKGDFAGSKGHKPHAHVTTIMVRLLTWLETLPEAKP